ncbi:MAG: hypothetical protein K2O06_15790 [Acetatifactor sp.]|nr:hypothetical protein [Acetatifactor sp.]
MRHSEKLEDTLLWQGYCKKAAQNREKIAWVEKVCKAAVAYLNDVRQEFKNYTLHDGTHVFNVLDAMGGLLGDWMEKLTEGEMELLILAASLHDLGMVYTEEEKALWLEKERSYKDFLKTYAPDWIGCRPGDWPEDIQQWYLRIQHPFRIFEVLNNKEWKKLMEERPGEIVSMRCIEAVCQAHGEGPEDIRSNPDLEYQAASDVDPLFCALLLRLADLLDFDDTRAPRVLYGSAAQNEKSRQEWQKHQASAGFRYPAKPSVQELPYKARCKNPSIEHGVRRFLDWVDEELENCARLQKFCNADWQRQFPFPRAVLRSEIESDGYVRGDFCLTMDQERILKLLMGENLYDNRDVFVRELLQNAIDAALLRGRMDHNFIPEDSRIDFWEWMDKEGNFWFRIDDQGTGMTLGMLQRYFLKVGNSYYTSQELKGDLCDHDVTGNYHGISRFGIGFLSCFLCGDSAEISTLYFDPKKNRNEEAVLSRSRQTDYGLRLQLPGLTGYYTIKNQAENHPADPLPMPEAYAHKEAAGVDRQGYRTKPGTSIVIRLNPGKLGTVNLRETVGKYLCAARMPVYYNNQRIGKTYNEVMDTVHKLAGKTAYELSPELKKKYDECFPAVKGRYPKLVSTVMPLDTEENRILPNLSGVLIKNEVCFEQELCWEERGETFRVVDIADCYGNLDKIKLYNKSICVHFSPIRSIKWYELKSEYNYDQITALKKCLDTFTACPQTEDQMGEAWLPFAKKVSIQEIWEAYLESFYTKSIVFDFGECGCPTTSSILGNETNSNVTYVYQGVKAKEESGITFGNKVIFLLDGECKPVVEVSRSEIVDMPLNLLVAMEAVLQKHRRAISVGLYDYKDLNKVTLREWREVRNSAVGQWVLQNHDEYFKGIMDKLENEWRAEIYKFTYHFILKIYNMENMIDHFVMAYLQDQYSMTINFEEGQIITFCDKAERGDAFDIFPPMMFCKAATDQSRKYLCHADSACRKGINMEHPFAAWLLENAVLLNQHFQRQFQQIVECLRRQEAVKIIKEFGIIREQLCTMSAHYGLEVKVIPQLNREDFWPPESGEGES